MDEKKITRAEAVRLLDALRDSPGGAESRHAEADEILLAVAPAEVRDAYNRLVDAQSWWAFG